MKKIYILVLVPFMFLGFCSADTIHVPGDQPTIQAGIDVAANGDIVLVAPGTYVENIDFKGKAITLTSSDGAESTIIDGGNSSNPKFGSVVTFKSDEGPDSLLEGFTLTNGTGTFFQNLHFGGGIYIREASPSVSNCTLSFNTCGAGGGLYGGSSSFPALEDCIFFGNSVAYGGACIFGRNTSIRLLNCSFHDNYAENEGGALCFIASDLAVTNCTFQDNSASCGGAISCLYGKSKINRCLFLKNSAVNFGGGVCASNPQIFEMDACIFRGNTAINGGGLRCGHDCSPQITNCIFESNTALLGGAISNQHWCDTTFENCTIVNNSATNGGGMSSFEICLVNVTNSIFWGNEPDAIRVQNAVTKVSYSNIEGGWSGDGNIDSNPCFIDPLNRDYHLSWHSPCINSGNNSNTVLFDLEGDPRPHMGTIDMGADEFHPHLYYTGTAAPNEDIDLKLIGMPQSHSYVTLGSGIAQNPHQTKWGPWYLVPPYTIVPLGKMPWSGYIRIHQRIPPDCPVPLDLPFQGLVRKLTNLEIVEVR